MKLEVALPLIRTTVEEMNGLFGKPVFNEWAIVTLLDSKLRIVHYEGPRGEEFRASLAGDLAALKDHLLSASHDIGDFEFEGYAHGTHVDAFMRVGRLDYLLCNHTEKTMYQITRDTDWLKAQERFLQLSEALRCDPVVID